MHGLTKLLTVQRAQTRLASSLAVLALLSLGLAPHALAQEGSEGGEEQAEEDGGLGLSGTVILDNAVGIGSFYRKDTASYVPTLSFIGRWAIPGTEGMSLSARQDLTLYGLSALEAYTDQDPGESVRPADTLVTLSLGKIAEDEAFTGLALSASLRFYVPTSPGSQARSLIMGVGPGIGLKRKFGFVTLSAGTRARYNFQRYDNAVYRIDPDDADSETAFQACVPRGNSKQAALRDDEIACGGSQNYDWRFYNSFSVDFEITRSLYANMTLFIINSFGIAIEQDEFTSEITRRTQNETQRDISWGVVELGYSVTPNLGLSLGISSQQTAKTADGKRLRFPWWDFEGPQSNSTSLYADVTGSF